MRNLLQILILSLILVLLSACGKETSSSSSSSVSIPDVVPSGTSSISLTWTAPSSRSDGTFLPNSDLAGYIIYMGTSQSNLSPIVDLVNDNVTQYRVEDLGQGSYYFSITAYDSDGMESVKSNVVQISTT